MSELGYEQGQEISYEFRWAHGEPDRLPALAAELSALNVDTIVTAGTPAAFAAQRATTTIPIVMATGVSVGTGLKEGLAGTGRNVTGMSDLAPGLSEQRLGLLRELVPDATLYAVLLDQMNPSGALAIREFQDAADRWGSSLSVFGVQGLAGLDEALAAMARSGAGGFIVVPSAMFFGDRKRLVDLALMHRLPAIYVRHEYVEVGGLMAYGTRIRDNYLRAAAYVDRILKGAEPADLPVEQPTAFELSVNLKAAQALGIAIPRSILLRAHQVQDYVSSE